MICPLTRKPSPHRRGATWAFTALMSLLVLMTSCGKSASNSTGRGANASGPATISWARMAIWKTCPASLGLKRLSRRRLIRSSLRSAG